MPHLLNRIFLRFGLATRLLLLGAAAFFLGSVALLYITASGMRDNAAIEMADQLRDGLDSLAFELNDYAVIGDFASVQQTLTRHVQKRNLVTASWSYNSTTLTQHSAPHDQTAPRWFVNLMHIPPPASQKLLEVGGRNYGHVFIALSNTQSINSIWATLVKQVNIILLGGALFLTLGAFLLRWGLRPLYSLTNAAHAIGRGDYSVRIASEGPPEMQKSIFAFNDMAHKLGELVQFLNDSHQAQSEQLHFNQQLLAVLPIPIFFKERDGRYLGVNHAWEILFGLNAFEVVGQTLNYLHANSPDIMQKHQDMDDDLWVNPGNQFYETTFITDAGNHLDLIYYKSTFTHTDGSVAGLIGAIVDITDRKSAEQREKDLNRQLLQSTKMDAIGHLTGGIAHDFNNILAGVLGYVELAKLALQKAAPNMPDKMAHYLQEVETAGTRAKDLVSQMLIFSRLAPDVQDGGVAPVLLKPIIKEVAGLLRSSIPATIELNFQFAEPDIKAAIQPVNLPQILLNLGINAKDSIGEYGKIDFILSTQSFDHAGCSSCKHDFSGHYIDITVSDNGSGIPPHILAKAFDPFFTTKEIGQGTGMGLSVVHGLVHALDGHIIVETEPGKGTAFHILLPVVDSAASVEPETPEAPLSTKRHLTGVRIMVVDDEHICTRMLQELLTEQGAFVVSFNHAPTALSAFMEHPDSVDVIITDETMPELSGSDMSVQILKKRPNLPIILCTGFSLHATPDSTKKAGIAAYMNKPVQLPKLVDAILSLTVQHDTPA